MIYTLGYLMPPVNSVWILKEIYQKYMGCECAACISNSYMARFTNNSGHMIEIHRSLLPFMYHIGNKYIFTGCMEPIHRKLLEVEL